MIRLVIVDDHTLFREGLASIIQVEPDIEVSGLAGTVQEAVEVVRHGETRYGSNGLFPARRQRGGRNPPGA